MTIVADMVAGIDAFAGTMHAQFDMTVIIVEPTKKSLEVYNQYIPLAKEAGTDDSIFVVGNKIQNEGDIKFIEENIPKSHLLGCIFSDDYLRDLDKTGDILEYGNISSENKKVVENIYAKLLSFPDQRNIRLKRVQDLHKKYVSQEYVIRANGDLTNQIDNNFKFL
jgi:CO dehydrogenase maturation factor